MMFVDFAKDLYSDAVWYWQSSAQTSSSESLRTLHEQGCVVLDERAAPDVCTTLCQAIDDVLSSDVARIWADDQGADRRIYGFETVYPDVLQLIDVDGLARLGGEYLGHALKSVFVLAARIDAVAGNLGSGGGWHRDSAFRHQFKSITYLSDVSLENGPFQYLRGTHTTRSKFFEGNGRPLVRNRFADADISLNDARLSSIVGAAGTTLLADTRGIHRGCPIETGRRYSITLYFWDHKTPAHFGKVLQGPVTQL